MPWIKIQHQDNKTKKVNGVIEKKMGHNYETTIKHRVMVISENGIKKVCEFLSFSPIVLKMPSCYIFLIYFLQLFEITPF